jgi:hypothetical protein
MPAPRTTAGAGVNALVRQDSPIVFLLVTLAVRRRKGSSIGLCPQPVVRRVRRAGLAPAQDGVLGDGGSVRITAEHRLPAPYPGWQLNT